MATVTEDLPSTNSKRLSALTIPIMLPWLREDQATTPQDQSEEMTASSPTLLLNSKTCGEPTSELRAKLRAYVRDLTPDQDSTAMKPSTPLT